MEGIVAVQKASRQAASCYSLVALLGNSLAGAGVSHPKSVIAGMSVEFVVVESCGPAFQRMIRSSFGAVSLLTC